MVGPPYAELRSRLPTHRIEVAGAMLCTPRSPRVPSAVTAPVLVWTALLVGCAPAEKDTADTDRPAGPAEQDILTTDMALDVGTLTGSASVVILPAAGADSVSLEVGGLSVTSVTVNGAAVDPAVHDGIATVPVTSDRDPVTVAMTYGFPVRTFSTFDGWMPDLGVSFLWPNYCSNLFPCDSSPVDGVTFSMDVTGYDPTLTAIFPTSTYSAAPSYMPGIAIGDYTRIDLGSTTAGTHVSAWYLPGEGEYVGNLYGTQHLTSVLDFFERTYGPYAFGPEIASVEVDWGIDSYGGMEHHPYFHVARFDAWKEETQIHEAGHGWYGDGVRLACWEDFVLSEGTTTYITAHGLEEVGGTDIWGGYVDYMLTPICTGKDVNAIVLPDETCNEIDFEDSDLWSLAPYLKGACFYEDVADLIGPDVLDQAIGDFYKAHVNTPAHMQDMIDTIEATADPSQKAAIEELVSDWLRTLECPADYATRCGTHQR